MSIKLLLKGSIGIGLTCFGIAVVQTAKRSLDRKLQDLVKTEEGENLLYTLDRIAIICPRCKEVKIAKLLEDQLERNHTCTSCGQKWRETHWGDIIL